MPKPHHIEQEQVAGLQVFLQAFLRRISTIDLKADCLKVKGQYVAQVLLVVNYQNPFFIHNLPQKYDKKAKISQKE